MWHAVFGQRSDQMHCGPSSRAQAQRSTGTGQCCSTLTAAAGDRQTILIDSLTFKAQPTLYRAGTAPLSHMYTAQGACCEMSRVV